jgi:hypothetical protein
MAVTLSTCANHDCCLEQLCLSVSQADAQQSLALACVHLLAAGFMYVVHVPCYRPSFDCTLCLARVLRYVRAAAAVCALFGSGGNGGCVFAV